MWPQQPSAGARTRLRRAIIYVDSSALLERYVDEPESAACAEQVAENSDWITARHTEVGMKRNLTRLLDGRSLEQTQASLRDDGLAF